MNKDTKELVSRLRELAGRLELGDIPIFIISVLEAKQLTDDIKRYTLISGEMCNCEERNLLEYQREGIKELILKLEEEDKED